MAKRDSTRVRPHTCVTCGALFTPVKYRPSVGKFRPYTGRQNCSAECAFSAKGKITQKRMRETRDQWVGPNNPMWKGACLLKNKSYRGPDWVRIAEAARHRDGHKCAHCGMTAEQHMDRWSQKLEVHHKVPFHEFTDHVAANKMSNLVTLCKVCHMTADRAIKQRQLLITFPEEPRRPRKQGIVKGSRNPRALLTEEAVSAIKAMLRAGQVQRVIAATFGVGTHVISAISTGQNWAHVP